MASWYELLLNEYVFKLVPAFVVAALFLLSLPKRWAIPRILLHIACFVLARDAMTAPGFWQINRGSLRLSASPEILYALSLFSAALAYGIYKLEARANQPFNFLRPGRHLGHSLLTASLAIAAVLLLVGVGKSCFALPSLPPPNPSYFLPILVFALIGNAYEELLFRGLLQETIATYTTSLHAAWLSALAFCFCHIFLAFNLTQIGTPLLVFTLIEGLAAAFAYRQSGFLAVCLTHGLVIFVMAMGWV